MSYVWSKDKHFMEKSIQKRKKVKKQGHGEIKREERENEKWEKDRTD